MGRNPFGGSLLYSLGILGTDIGRIRDVYTNDDGDKIFILHRNYGEDGLQYDEIVKKHPNYVDKHPTDDYSYWIYEFSIPEPFIGNVKDIASASNNTPAFDAYKKVISDMSNGIDNQATKHANDIGKTIVKSITESILDNESKVVENEFGSVTIKQLGKID